DGVSVSDRAKMSRRVPSAKARKSWLSDASLSFLRTTIWLYVNHVRSFLQGVFLHCSHVRQRLGSSKITAAAGKQNRRPLMRALLSQPFCHVVRGEESL